MSEEKNIHEAIIGVMKDVGYVQKEKKAGLNYSYAGEAALIAAIRPAMVEHGIYMHVCQIVKVNRENYVTAKGTAMANTMVQAVVRFTHAPTETHIDVATIGEGADSGDKSANKASTGQYKYAIRQTFCIETGDDPDQTPSEQVSRAVKPLSKVEQIKKDQDSAEDPGFYVEGGKKVDEEYPVVQEAINLGGEVRKYSKKDLMKKVNIDTIRAMTEKFAPQVIEAIGKLEDGHTYTIVDVADILNKGE